MTFAAPHDFVFCPVSGRVCYYPYCVLKQCEQEKRREMRSNCDGQGSAGIPKETPAR
jgi:hypothetical protein